MHRCRVQRLSASLIQLISGEEKESVELWWPGYFLDVRTIQWECARLHIHRFHVDQPKLSIIQKKNMGERDIQQQTRTIQFESFDQVFPTTIECLFETGRSERQRWWCRRWLREGSTRLWSLGYRSRIEMTTTYLLYRDRWFRWNGFDPVEHSIVDLLRTMDGDLTFQHHWTSFLSALRGWSRWRWWMSAAHWYRWWSEIRIRWSTKTIQQVILA